MLLSVIQEEDQLDDWSPVMSDYDWVTNPKALREAFSIHKFPCYTRHSRFTLNTVHVTADLQLLTASQ